MTSKKLDEAKLVDQKQEFDCQNCVSNERQIDQQLKVTNQNLSEQLDQNDISILNQIFGFKDTMLNYEYSHFVNDTSGKNYDQDRLIEVEKHKKLYGIIPDRSSKEYLQKAIEKLEYKKTKYRRQITQLEINKLKHQISKGCLNEAQKCNEEFMQYTMLKTANFDLAKDFEKKIGKLSYNLNTDQDRRQLLFKGLNEKDYHRFFDTLYSQIQLQPEKLGLSPKINSNQCHEVKSEHHDKRQSWTIKHTDWWYRLLDQIKIISCMISIIVYPYYIIARFPKNLDDKGFWLMTLIELIFGVEIVLGFFLQPTNELNQPLNLSLAQVSENYIKNKFLLDFICILPLGQIASTLINQKLRILYYIKCIRFKYLMFIFNPRLFQPLINWYIERKQSHYLMDQEKRKEINEDLIFITFKIYVKNVMRIVSLGVKITIIVYMISNFWFVFVFFQGNTMYLKMKNTISGIDYVDQNVGTTFLNNDSWVINYENNGFRVVVIQMYFMMTSLSTVGFGDYYPKNDYERIVGSFILLIGVTVFSYIMMKLADTIINFNIMNGESMDNQEIEDFFTLLKKFNYGFPINHAIQHEIREFLNLRNNFDRLNFLKTQTDVTLLKQLPPIIQTEIYTDFLFKDFLWKFRRLFRFNCHQLASFAIISKNKKGKKGLKLMKGSNKKTRTKSCRDIKIDELQKDHDNLSCNSNNSPELKIQYPYFDYKNEMYGDFMIQLMNKLEIRMYKKNVIIATEMDECLEIFFVENGFYKVGYQINNQQFFKRRFGMFTVIGGFQICYDRRFNFIFKSSTEIKGLAIRKDKFKQLLWQYQDFSCQLKSKFWTFYSQQIFQPLKKSKNADLLEFNQREDFRQVLISKDKENENLVRICIKENLRDLGINMHDRVNMQIDVNNLILSIEKKLPKLAHRAFKIHQRFEKLYRILLDRIIRAIANGNVDLQNAVEICKHFQKLVVPFSLVTQSMLFDIKKFDQIQFDLRMCQLDNAVFGVNPFKKVKNLVHFEEKKNKYDWELSSKICEFSLLMLKMKEQENAQQEEDEYQEPSGKEIVAESEHSMSESCPKDTSSESSELSSMESNENKQNEIEAYKLYDLMFNMQIKQNKKDEINAAYPSKYQRVFQAQKERQKISQNKSSNQSFTTKNLQLQKQKSLKSISKFSEANKSNLRKNLPSPNEMNLKKQNTRTWLDRNKLNKKQKNTEKQSQLILDKLSNQFRNMKQSMYQDIMCQIKNDMTYQNRSIGIDVSGQNTNNSIRTNYQRNIQRNLIPLAQYHPYNLNGTSYSQQLEQRNINQQSGLSSNQQASTQVLNMPSINMIQIVNDSNHDQLREQNQPNNIPGTNSPIFNRSVHEDNSNELLIEGINSNDNARQIVDN